MRKYWTPEEIELLKTLYPDNSTEEIAASMQRSEKAIYSQAHLLSLTKSEEFQNSEKSGRIKPGEKRGSETTFKKGHKTWNAGLKGICIGGVQTQFKKGSIPHNHKPVGSIREKKDGYIEIKTEEPNKWELLHRFNWKQIYGEIPEDHNIKFKDGNKTNCEVSNLQLITKSENMTNNTIHRYPEELKSTIRTISKLKKTIRNYGKE